MLFSCVLVPAHLAAAAARRPWTFKAGPVLFRHALHNV
jgi:hypothetical protein